MEAHPIKRRRYRVRLVTEVEIEIDDDVLDDAMTEEWQQQFYRLDRNDVVAMIARNMDSGVMLSSLDGFAHWSNKKAEIVDDRAPEPDEVEEIEDAEVGPG